MSTLPESLSAARFLLVRQRPYMAHALFSLVLVPVAQLAHRSLGAMGVDQYWRLYYDPEAVGRWQAPEIAGVLYHELWHLLNAHHDRLKMWPPLIANLGGDLAINSIIQREKLPLPEGAVMPEQFGFPPQSEGRGVLRPAPEAGGRAGYRGAGRLLAGSGERQLRAIGAGQLCTKTIGAGLAGAEPRLLCARTARTLGTTGRGVQCTGG